MIPWQVTQLKVLSGHRLEVGFADGLSGVVDLSKERFEGILAPLADDRPLFSRRLPTTGKSDLQFFAQ